MRTTPTISLSTPLALLAILALLGAACAEDSPADPETGPEQDGAAADGPLEGLLALEDGVCDEGGVSAGSSFRMVQPGGDLQEGPFVENADSPCGDTTWTPLRAGEDGGLRLGEHQPSPEEPFGEDGHGVASAIVEPTAFFAVDFAVSTGAVDPQTEQEVAAPRLEVADGEVSGQITAWSVGWNQQFFNQGAPKPDGQLPGGTSEPEGTYDPATGELRVVWASEIVGGPFNGFTGLWHLEGRFEPAS